MTPPESYGKKEVIKIINSVLQQVNNTPLPATLYQELSTLKDIIETLRLELRAAAPSEIITNHIPNAADELDAVTRHTEQATHNIMNCCDLIQAELNHIPINPAAQIQDHIICIYEACTFHDITSQRLTKVITALKKIDQKTQTLIHLLESHFTPGANTPAPETQSLMNGPQLPGHGISQDDIDRILLEMSQNQSL